MAESEAGESTAEDRDAELVRAWWMSLLTGESETPHPLFGNQISAALEGDTLVISGRVKSAADRTALQREASVLRGQGVNEIRNQVEVVERGAEESGLLMQTLISMFSNAELAQVAADSLRGRLEPPPAAEHVLSPDSSDSRRELHSLLPKLWWKDAERALGKGRTLLIVTVDETAAFAARELLDEETRSSETLVLPPETAEAAEQQIGETAQS